MQGGPGKAGGFNPANLGQDTLRLVGNLCFALFVAGVLVFTIIAATYRPEDPLIRPSAEITAFLTSASDATFRDDDSVVRTGEDFASPSNRDAVAAVPFINVTDVPSAPTADAAGGGAEESVECDPTAPIDCNDPEVFHTMMRFVIEQFKDVHFYRFGKPARGDGDSSCDMAWRYRPKDAKRNGFFKDYRRFAIAPAANCTYTVVSMGEYHTGVNARRKKKKGKGPPIGGGGGDGGFGPKGGVDAASAVPVVGEAVNDSLPVVESESSFAKGKYLIYMGGGDRCKSMNHYLWSLLCALGEAQYLNRTLVMDLSICLSAIYTSSGRDEEGKDFRFYFDFEHLKSSASVLDQGQFWADWGKWHRKDGLGLYLVEDFRVTPMKLAAVEDALVMRKFGSVEPDNYWYRVCEGGTEAAVRRPWNLIWKSPRLLDIVSGIASNMSWDFDSVHVVRGEKAKNTELWPNLAADTSPESLLATLRDKVDEGRDLYIATNEEDASFFDPLRERYSVHFLDDFRELWGEGSEWYAETKALNRGLGVEMDGYMRVEVDTEVFLRGKMQLETFNDLTRDCRDGSNTCTTLGS